MPVQTQFKPNAPLCRHGMREDCPVKQCHLWNSKPTVLYSSAPKGPTLIPPIPEKVTTNNGPFAQQQRQFGVRDEFSGEACRFQHAMSAPSYPTSGGLAASSLSGTSGTGTKFGTAPVDHVDGSGLVQAADGVASYRVWIGSQMDAQKAKIKAMSEQFSIPIPNLESSPLDFLSLMPPPVPKAVPTTKTEDIMSQEKNGRSVFDERKIPSAPPAPRMPPALPMQGLRQLDVRGSLPTAPTITSGPFATGVPLPSRLSPLDQGPKPVAPAEVVSKQSQVTSIAPKKDDLAYKTTPCKHFTVNRGWCPWGDRCGFIHDPELQWVPPLERTSGGSTPSSWAHGDNKSSLSDKTTVDLDLDLRRSVSSKSAHCWGYIQGICPHSDTCRYLHPADIVPYIKYTPCLTWPRCGYPIQDCALKHPQVDKLTATRRTQPASTTSTAMIVPQARSGEVFRPEAYSDTSLPPQQRSQPSSTTPALLTPVGGFVIPHDEAYESARLHHRPTAPSAEMFSPAPVRPIVRLRRPSEDMPRDQAPEMHCGLGTGAYQGRARSVSIAVQKLGAEFSGPLLQAHGKAFVRGHGRGKSMNL